MGRSFNCVIETEFLEARQLRRYGETRVAMKQRRVKASAQVVHSEQASAVGVRTLRPVRLLGCHEVISVGSTVS